MRVLLDTSVLIAAMVTTHPEHSRSFPWLQRIHADTIEGVVSAHSLAEVYSVLTRLPIQPRITAQMAHDMVSHNIIERCTIISLQATDYIHILLNLVNRGLVGGVTYDALVMHTAHKVDVDYIVTLNTKDMIRIYPEFISKIIEP